VGNGFAQELLHRDAVPANQERAVWGERLRERSRTTVRIRYPRTLDLDGYDELARARDEVNLVTEELLELIGRNASVS